MSESNDAGADSNPVESRSVSSRPIGTRSSVFHLVSNFVKQVGKVAVVYLLGYYNFSPSWLLGPVILSVLREEWGREKELKRNIAKAAALSNEKDVILARVDDLPAWVFFPDVERAEWINRILKQIWPNVNHFAKDLIKDSVEPAIKESLNAYKLRGFSFQKMRLGTIPPRIGGIKVYDKNVSRNEIIMDMDLFYAGDCDISFSLGGMNGGIKDFQIHGMIRIVMKPLIKTIPLVGGLQIYFLNNPTLDFNLVGVADLLDLPGLSDMLRKVVIEQVAAMMVLPNKLPIVLSDAVPPKILKFPEPQGVLRVHVVEAKQLMKKDISITGKGKSDPYAILNVGAESFKSQTINNSIDPKWDYWCEFCLEVPRGRKLVANIYDKDVTGKDESLGRATVDVFGITEKGEVDTWLSLEEAKTGMVHLRMTWLQLSESTSDLKQALLETQMLRVTSMSTAILMLFIDSAKNLPKSGGKSGGAPPDVTCTITLGKKTCNTSIQYWTDCPVFEQGFSFLVSNPETDILHLKIMDHRANFELGNVNFNISLLLGKDHLELQDEPFPLQNSAPDAKIIVSMRLRVLKFSGGTAKEHDEISPYGEQIAPLPRQKSVKKQDSTLPSVTKKSEISPEATTPKAQSPNEKPVEPVTDVMTSAQAPPKVESMPPRLHRRQMSGGSATSDDASLGKIQLTLRYSVQRQRLIVVVHKIANLPLKDPSNIPDPFVKLYLLPERSKDSKRKTETVKDNCNPTYDETFEYVMSQGEMSNRQLEVTVLTQKAWKSPILGQVVINLADLDVSKPITSWFELHPGAPKEKSQ